MSEDPHRALEDRLSQILPGDLRAEITGVASVGAQRQTFFVDLVDRHARDPADERTAAVAQVAATPLAEGDVEIESRLLREAAAAGVAVPGILAWDAQSATLVTRYVTGESIPRRILRLVEADPELGERLTRDCGRALAGIHSIPSEPFAALPDLRDPLRYVDELEAGLEALPTPHPALRLGLRWLRRHAPDPWPSATVVHGDFRNGNLLVTESGLAAVLDWELAHLGDPMEDLAWLCLRCWRFGADGREVGGFGRRETLREAYEVAGGRWREAGFRWWSVARTLWWALGLARQAEAFLGGHSNSIVLAASGRRVVELEYDLMRAIEG